jgi:hypothetical protein
MLWARLVIQQLASRPYSEETVENVLSTPQPLEALYANFMNKIKDVPYSHHAPGWLSKTALAWVLLAMRPLKEMELLHALAIMPHFARLHS